MTYEIKLSIVLEDVRSTVAPFAVYMAAVKVANTALDTVAVSKVLSLASRACVPPIITCAI